MNEASKTSSQPILPGLSEPTSLPGLEDGTTPSDSQDGQKTPKSGQEAAHVSRSPMPERSKALMTHGIFGQNFDGSLQSAVLQQSLANRLIARLDDFGSNLYEMTWILRAMPSRMSLLTLRASARTKSGSGSIGWQTPRARGDAGGQRWRNLEARNLEDQARIFCLKRGLTIEEVARLSLSPTFVRRLMGYPVGWECCAVSAMQSTRKSRQSS